jgi:hypothetical protein
MAACGSAGEPSRGGLEAVGELRQALLPAYPIDVRKSILVTDTDIVSQFTLFDVLNQLVTQANVPGLTPLGLFQQMFDTENAAPGFTSGPHCVPDPQDTAAFPLVLSTSTSGSINQWPAECPRLEGLEASRDPFSDPTADNAYFATTLSNRFDLAPPDGSTCGEFRVNFARRSGIPTPTDPFPTETRNFIAFEARLPNPTPSLGLAGCKPVVAFWQGLSDPALAPSDRASKLHDFYFKGLPGFAPVIDIGNFGQKGGPQSGQVRINQFLFIQTAVGDWSPREFALVKSCSGASCKLQMLPHFDKDVPAKTLFDPSSADPRAASFQTSFLPGAVERLALNDINAINYPAPVPDPFNIGDDQIITTDTDYRLALGSGASPLRTAIQQRLSAIASDLTPDQIVARAMSLSCAGCHLKSLGQDMGHGVSLPTQNSTHLQTAEGFVQVSEDSEPVDDDPVNPTRTRFVAQPTVLMFLNHRLQVMNDFLAPVPGFERANGWSSPQGGIALVGAPVTQGQTALRVVPTSGFAELDSIPFSTVNLVAAGTTPTTASLDLERPNVTGGWQGVVSMFVTIQSARVYNQYLGQVSLAGLPGGAFSPVSFTLPSAVGRALALGVNDVDIVVQLSVPAGTAPYYFDNLRFR